MTALNWKDGGDKPLTYAKGPCPICGEAIMVPTRDYYYAKDGDRWVQAHAACVNKPVEPERDILIDELMMIREMLAQIKEQLQRIADQGAH